ncbi:MAG: hypothetical protein GC190_16130 [Alphaproteobacteria bacterium]|nr:hypothetical protein [Alphaproteobacteria bacterium]
MASAARLLGRFELLVGFIAAAMILGAGPLYRFAGVDLGMAFNFLKWVATSPSVRARSPSCG